MSNCLTEFQELTIKEQLEANTFVYEDTEVICVILGDRKAPANNYKTCIIQPEHMLWLIQEGGSEKLNENMWSGGKYVATNVRTARGINIRLSVARLILDCQAGQAARYYNGNHLDLRLENLGIQRAPNSKHATRDLLRENGPRRRRFVTDFAGRLVHPKYIDLRDPFKVVLK